MHPGRSGGLSASHVCLDSSRLLTYLMVNDRSRSTDFE